MSFPTATRASLQLETSQTIALSHENVSEQDRDNYRCLAFGTIFYMKIDSYEDAVSTINFAPRVKN